MKIEYGAIVFALLLAGCKPGNGNSASKNTDGTNWEAITEEVKPCPKPLPMICNIEEMTPFGSDLLLKSDKTDFAFVVLRPDLEYYIPFGTYGEAPEDLLPTVQLIHGSDKHIKLYTGYKVKEFGYVNDSIRFVAKADCKVNPDFYQSIYALDDTLCCVYKLAPHETGVHLVNILTQESYDSISVAQGYFDNKDIPYELTCNVYKDKLVIGRKKYNRIELYHIDLVAKKLTPAFSIDHKNASPEHYLKKGACYMNNINTDQNGFYMLNQDTDEPGKRTYIDGYTWDGKPVKRIKLDGLYNHAVLMGRTFYLKKYTDDDNLYTFSL